MTKLKGLCESRSKINVVKKSKVSKRYLSKQNNMKYLNHGNVNYYLYDDDKTTMGQVNNDCLAEIFMYVPVLERPKIALVCKRWEEALDESWFDDKKLALTHWKGDEDSHVLERNYPTIDKQFRFLKSLLYKCGHYLKDLDLSAYLHCNILPIINEYCPNLVKLRIRIDYHHISMLTDAFSNLSNLQALTIIFDDCFNTVVPVIPITLIDSLRHVADTLTYLSISNWTSSLIDNASFPEEITNVIMQMNVLNAFVTTGITCPDSLCDYLNDSETIFFTCDHMYFMEVRMSLIQQFEYIEELDFIEWEITDDGIYNIANTMKQLHTLRVSCNMLTDTGIITCTKMKNLKYIDFNGFNNCTDSSIRLLKNMTYVSLPWSNKITEESAIKVLENSPNMTSYSVRNINITNIAKFFEKAAEISEKREKELQLVVSLEPHQTTYGYLNIMYVDNNGLMIDE